MERSTVIEYRKMLKKSKLMENLEYHSYPNTFERQCTRHVSSKPIWSSLIVSRTCLWPRHQAFNGKRNKSVKGRLSECGHKRDKLIPNTSTVSFKELHRVLCRLSVASVDSSTFQMGRRRVTRSTWRGKCYEIFSQTQYPVTKIVTRGCGRSMYTVEPIHNSSMIKRWWMYLNKFECIENEKLTFVQIFFLLFFSIFRLIPCNSILYIIYYKSYRILIFKIRILFNLIFFLYH